MDDFGIPIFYETSICTLGYIFIYIHTYIHTIGKYYQSETHTHIYIYIIYIMDLIL